MKRLSCRTTPFAAVASLLCSVAAGCGDASPASTPEVPEFDAPEGSVDEPPSSEETPSPGMPAASPAEPVTPSEETTDGEIPLEPSGAGGASGATPADPDATGMGGTDATGMGGADGVLEPLPKFVGNITTRNSLDTDGFTFSDHWNQITPENAGKWGEVQRDADSARNWGALDAIYDYAQQKGLVFKQHTFVWGAQQPDGDIGQADVQSWIQEFCTRYPNTRVIDVVNEPPPHTEPSYADAIGGGTDGDWQWIVNAFTWAREACPNAVLIMNDYNNIEFGNQTQHFIDIAKTIQSRGAPIDALGAQAHGLSGNVSGATMRQLLTRMHDDTGLPVYITEYDINLNDDAAQLAKFQDHFAFFLDTEWIRGVTVWGWILGKTWVDNSGLIRNGTPRPAMTWLMGELGRPVPNAN